MTQETGTLKELNVQPGDVVEYCAYSKRRATIAGWRNGRCYSTDQEIGSSVSLDSTGAWRIISRANPPLDLTAITTPFGLLDAATQDALRAHGGPYEWLDADGEWVELHWPTWRKQLTYRVKPQPKRETVKFDAWIAPKSGMLLYSFTGTPVRVTFDRVDGVIDLSTYRLEARS